jgi:hypothetical protein
MDPLIIDSTPKGSAILAYGAARGPQWNAALLAIIAGIFVVIGLIAGLIWLKATHVNVPTQTLASVLITPARIHKSLTTEQEKDLPAPWRAAIESESHFPAVLGISLDQGRIHAYAIVARTASVAGASGLDVASDGPFKLLTDGSHPMTEQKTAGNLLRGAFDLQKHAVVFFVDASMLDVFAGDETRHMQSELIRGTWDGRVGHFILSDEGTASSTPMTSSMFAVLGSSAADNQPAVTGLLSQGIDLRSFSQTPQTLALDVANGGSLSLSWSQHLSSSDASLLGAVRGSGQRKAYPLPDASDATELLPGSTSGTFSGPQTVLLSDHLASSTLLLLQTQPIQPECPGKNVRFTLQGEALQAVLRQWSVPESWRSLFASIRLTQSGQDAYLCLKSE